jgi:hypothetical protein
MMERGSSKHGARLDEQMAAETVSEIWSASTAG